MIAAWVVLTSQKIAVILLAAGVLLGCVSAESWEAVHILNDIEAGSRPSKLKSITPSPARKRNAVYLPDGLGLADLYEPNQPVGGALVLVPGFTPDGKDDVHIVNLAYSLARARFRVLVPDLPGARGLRVRLEDADTIANAVTYLAQTDPVAQQQGVAVIAISYAVGLAVLASLQEGMQERWFGVLVSIGGYYDAKAMVTFTTTGRFREPGLAEWRFVRPHPAVKWMFLASNIDLLDDPRDRAALTAIVERRLLDPKAPIDDLAEGLGPEGKSLLDLMTNANPERVTSLLALVPDKIRNRIETLSLQNYDLSHLAGRLILIHGRKDNMIPYTESLRLNSTIADSELFIIDGFTHVDPATIGITGRLQLVDALMAVLKRRKQEMVTR